MRIRRVDNDSGGFLDGNRELEPCREHGQQGGALERFIACLHTVASG